MPLNSISEPMPIIPALDMGIRTLVEAILSRYCKYYIKLSLVNVYMDQALIKIETISEIKGKKPTIIIGFPGTGLVGSVAAS